MPAIASRTLNPLSGIIPEFPDGYTNFESDPECRFIFSVPAPIDHYKVIQGKPLGSKGSLTRAYNPPVIPAVGSLYRKEKSGSLLNYNGVSTNQEVVLEGFTYHIEIKEYTVYLNGYKVVTAPAHFKPAPALKFCKAVMTSMITDDQNLKDQYDRVTTIKDPVLLKEPYTVNGVPAPDTTIIPVKQYPFPVKVQPEGWVNHLRLSIQEVPE